MTKATICVNMEWIIAVPAGTSPSGKTLRYRLEAKVPQAILGIVQWRAGWRKYVFEPAYPTVYEEDCLRDIAGFIEMLTRDHKRKQLATLREREAHAS